MTPELNAGQFPLQPSEGTFLVDQQGNVEAEFSRKPQRIIHRELLNPRLPRTSIDLDKVTGSSGAPTMYAVLQDFGLPFRTITINQVFETHYEAEDPIYTIAGEGKPSKLLFACPSYGWNEQTRVMYGEDFNDEAVILEPGQHVVFAHDGQSTDFRTGFIQNDALIVAFSDDWRDPSNLDHYQGYTPIIDFRYDGNVLLISSFDEQIIEIIYEKLASQADVVTAQAIPGDAEISEILGMVQNILTPEKLQLLASLAERLQTSLSHKQALKIALVRNKDLLNQTNRRLQEALHENERLKSQGASTKQTDFSSTFSKEKTGSTADPYGHCATLGILPERVFDIPPGEAEKLISGLRRVYSTIYHPDINKQVDQNVIKTINNAADKILQRLKTGSWGRN